MKKVIFKMTAVCASALILASCGGSKNMLTLSSLNGEWNITEVDGQKITDKKMPFIGFDVAQKRIYGNSGCNRMMGSFDVNAKPGTIDLGALASTRMACPDMSGERELLQALDKVVRFDAVGEVKPVNKIALYGTDNTKLMVIEKK